ncbi:tea1 [Acrasis kona]|uniref:Tea1 n=1 Tax=Acrasis kona TaxID=1008807 RepID=A0AAW2YTV0_9EUKA
MIKVISLVIFYTVIAYAQINQSNTGVWKNSTVSSSPILRVGASSATTNSHQWIVFAGGDETQFFNDLHSLDLTKPDGGWTNITTTNTPSKRAWHSSVIINNKFYVFGGFDKTKNIDSTVYELDLSQQSPSWKTLSSSNAASPRFLHSAVTHNNKMYTFGGMTADSKFFNDVHEFDPSTNKWTQIKTNEGPSPRAAHSATQYADRMYIFGGTASGEYYGDTWALDLKSFTWTKIKTTPSESAVKFPSPRAGAITALVKENLWIFGGQTAGGKSADLWVLSLEGHAWSEVINIRPSNQPTARYSGVAAISPSTQAFNILGGDGDKPMNGNQWFFVVLQ